MTHYETLGVSKTASQDEITAAYRALASKLHPDRNDDPDATARMAAVNAAYTVLFDPERRAEYDEGPAKALLVDAMEVLTQFFSAALESTEHGLMSYCRSRLAEFKDKGEKLLRTSTAERAKLLKRRAKVRAKAGDNLFHAIIDKRVSSLDEDIKFAQHGALVHAEVTRLLDVYESDEEEMSAFFEVQRPGAAPMFRGSVSIGWGRP